METALWIVFGLAYFALLLSIPFVVEVVTQWWRDR